MRVKEEKPLLTPIGAAAGKRSRRPSLRAIGRWLLTPLALMLLITGCTGRNITSVPGWAGAMMKDGEVYVATVQGEVLRLDSESGEVLWRYPEEGDGLGPFYATPAVDDTHVYVGSYNNRLYAFWKDTGDLDWQGVTHGPIVGGATLVDDKVLVASSDGNVYAYKADDGERLWQHSASDKVWSAPAVANGLAYFGSLDHHVYAVSLEDGTLVWKYETGSGITAQPLVVNEMVVVGSFDRNLYALDGRTGDVVWTFGAENWFWASAVTDGTTIYAASLDKKLYALDMEGNLRWSFEATADLVSTPAMTPNGVALATEKGRLYLISTKDGHEDWFYDVEGQSIRAPLSADGSMVLAASRKSTVLMADIGRGRLAWSTSTEK